jgi:hypothetical protein
MNPNEFLGVLWPELKTLLSLLEMLAMLGIANLVATLIYSRKS